MVTMVIKLPKPSLHLIQSNEKGPLVVEKGEPWALNYLLNPKS